MPAILGPSGKSGTAQLLLSSPPLDEAREDESDLFSFSFWREEGFLEDLLEEAFEDFLEEFLEELSSLLSTFAFLRSDMTSSVGSLTTRFNTEAWSCFDDVLSGLENSGTDHVSGRLELSFRIEGFFLSSVGLVFFLDRLLSLLVIAGVDPKDMPPNERCRFGSSPYSTSVGKTPGSVSSSPLLKSEEIGGTAFCTENRIED